MKGIAKTFLLSFLIVFSLVTPVAAKAPASITDVWGPTFSITSVVTDSTVTITTYNFTANDSYKVYMGAMGTRGVGGILVKTIDTGSGGSFTATFDIPSELHGLYQIAIRLESPYSGFYAYNWFNNNASGSTTYGTGGPYSYYGYTVPTFSIASVSTDSTVTITTYNFPANDTYEVRMGAMGTQALGGILIKSISTGSGGSFSATFDIPDELKGLYQVAIRLDSPSSGYYAYNWFYNKTSGGSYGTGGPYSTGYYGIPTFSIATVSRNSTVTIRTNNFPANDTFNVRMGYMGTQGVGGILVKTLDTGDGGVLAATFDIPAELSGQYQIAIRLESTTSGLYAYNWFYNN